MVNAQPDVLPVAFRLHQRGFAMAFLHLNIRGRLILGFSVLCALLACVVAAPVVGQETTPAMVAAAAKEGKVVWYSSIDVKVAELIAKTFRAEYPNIQIEVERSGSERVFQRINQEYQSGIKNVDVVNSSDASHFLYWKQQKWLAPHVPPHENHSDAQR